MSDRPHLSKQPAGDSSTSPAGPRPAPPRFVLLAAAALALAGVMAVLTASSLYVSSVKTWVRDSSRDAIADQMSDKLKDVRKAGPTGGDRAAQLTALQNEITKIKPTPSDQLTGLANQIKTQVTGLESGASGKGKDALKDLQTQATNLRDIQSQIADSQKRLLISSLVVLVALGVAAAAVLKGRHWSRWAVLILWIFITLSGTPGGITSVMSVTADIPGLFKVPAFLSGLSLVVAVVLTNLRPSVEYFNFSRPVRAAGRQRRGLFSPPPPRQPRTTPAAEPRSAGSGPDRARTKQRASQDAVAKGAELARTRAKASKSRRSGS